MPGPPQQERVANVPALIALWERLGNVRAALDEQHSAWVIRLTECVREVLARRRARIVEAANGRPIMEL